MADANVHTYSKIPGCGQCQSAFTTIAVHVGVYTCHVHTPQTTCVHMQTHAYALYNVHTLHTWKKLTAVGFEPTQLALVLLESTPLDHSGKLS